MKKGFSKKLISTSLVGSFDSNTHKENGCFSLKNGVTETRNKGITEQRNKSYFYSKGMKFSRYLLKKSPFYINFFTKL